MSSTRRRVFLNEFNVLMEGAAYLPVVSGTLQAYASTLPDITDRYEFAPPLFHRDDSRRILSLYSDPAVAAFSVQMWNEQLNLRVAEEIKRKWPDCLIVFGGPQVPYDAAAYMRIHPFVDVTVRGEGEQAFADILLRFSETRDFSGIPGTSFRDLRTGSCVRNEMERDQVKDLDAFPSPYLLGYYDELLGTRTDLQFQTIIETNRGCPFPCTFCYWGMGGLSRKYRYYGLDRVRSVLDWCGQHRIRYVFNADSNFGMIKRDMEIARMIVETKLRYGYPEKFRTCFGKNTDEKIYEIAALLHKYDLEKGITLARQSNDETTLRNIRRENIKLSMYRNLQVRFNREDIPVYTELILGLPGETCDSWLLGMEEVLQAGIKNQLFVYFCQVYPNTEMGDPAYQEKFKIRTARVPLNEIHGAIRPEGLVTEYEDIIVTTSSMSMEDWKRMAVLSWVMQVFHGMKAAFYVMVYLVNRHGRRHTDFLNWVASNRMDRRRCPLITGEVLEFREQSQRILAGSGRGRVLPEFGAIYWDEEEASFLRMMTDADRFYTELHHLVEQYLSEVGIRCDPEELREVMAYQKVRVPRLYGRTPERVTFRTNLPEYFERALTAHPVNIRPKAQTMHLVNARLYNGDRRAFARDTVLHGRKSGTTLISVRWSDVDASPLGQAATTAADPA